MKELMIIRHARSLYNVEDTDDLDAGLTDFGRQQADMVGEFLKKEFPNVAARSYWNIFTSPFLRCLETTEYIQKHLGCAVTVDGRLGEMTVDYHELDSLNVENRGQGFPYNWSNFDPTDFAHERMDAYINRLEEFWQWVPDRMIIITHGSPVLSFIRMHEGKFGSVPLWNHSIGNCSMTWIRGNRMIWKTRELFWEMPDKVWSCGK